MPEAGTYGAVARGSPEHDHERELVARIRAGDELAFEALVVEHYSAMCTAAASLLRSREAVEDIVQDVLRKLWAIRASWQPHGVRAYLLLAVRHETLSVIRRVRRERGLAGRIAGHMAPHADDRTGIPGMGDAPRAVDDVLVTEELRSAIQAAAVDLPRRSREVFLLRWRDGLRHAEIAQRLGLSIKTVEMHLTRALKAVRARLVDLGLP